MKMPVPIGDVQKNATEQIKVALQEFKGAKLCDIRVHGKFSGAQVYMPTAKGIAFAVTKLPEVISILIEAQRVAHENGLLPQNEE